MIGITTLPPVPVGEPTPFGDGLVATVARVDPVQIEAIGPGEIAGPGLAVIVDLRNESGREIDLGGVVVNASYGDGVPASSSDSAPASPATGVLLPGESDQGVYLFRVQPEEAASLLVEVNYNDSPNVVLIRR